MLWHNYKLELLISVNYTLKFVTSTQEYNTKRLCLVCWKMKGKRNGKEKREKGETEKEIGIPLLFDSKRN